jgi:hypothetical protein
MVNGPLRTAEYDRERRTLGSIASEHRRAELQSSRCVLACQQLVYSLSSLGLAGSRLMAPNLSAMFNCAAHYVNRIIKGAKVEDSPVE